MVSKMSEGGAKVDGMGKNAKTTKRGPEGPVEDQLAEMLVDVYGYDASRIERQFPIRWGSKNSGVPDIVVFRDGAGRDQAADIEGIVDAKKRGGITNDGRTQLKTYLTATSASWGMISDGAERELYVKPEGTSQVVGGMLSDIPKSGQKPGDYWPPVKEDMVPFRGVELKNILRDALKYLSSNSPISSKERVGDEMVKLIFAKVWDENSYPQNTPDFWVGSDERPQQVKKRIDALFERVVDDTQHSGLFESGDRIRLNADNVAWVVERLQHNSLTSSESDVVGDAFEVFAENGAVGGKGQFFTPRPVVNLAIALVGLEPNMTVCDPACGSGGFLIASMRHVWETMRQHRQWKNLKPDRLREAERNMAGKCFFGIDKEATLVRLAKAYMSISGDGSSNMVAHDSLSRAADFEGEAKTKFTDNGNGLAKFDCVMTNPPFTATSKVVESKSQNFQLGHRWKQSDGTWQKTSNAKKSNPYVLFIERCMDLVKPGGCLAIVLPETVFHAPTTGYLRHYITQHGWVQAVVDLPHDTFRPHCNAKTNLLIVRKGPRPAGSPNVLMCKIDHIGHDHRGKPLKDSGNSQILDDTPDAIAELSEPDRRSNKFVKVVAWKKLADSDNWIPRNHTSRKHTTPTGRRTTTLGKLAEPGEHQSIQFFTGHGSPSSREKGQGDIPYIRVKDIVNWEMYHNPTSKVTDETYQRLAGGRHATEKEDIVFVSRGSYRVGTVAMASSLDKPVLLTRELLTFRVLPDNPAGLTPYYLLWLLSNEQVQQQIPYLVALDTTMPNIGGRWKDIKLAIHTDPAEIGQISGAVEKAMKQKWAAQNLIEKLREQTGVDITT